MVPAAPSGSTTETDQEPNGEKGRQGHGAGREDCKQNSQTIVHDLYSGSFQKVVRSIAARLKAGNSNSIGVMRPVSTWLRREP
jgi:hypothetical protein